MKKGFTLIELLVVVAIIALLATLGVVAYSSAKRKSRDAKRLADMKQLQTAMEMFSTEYRTYKPNNCGTDGSLVSLCTASNQNGLADFLPGVANFKDPNGTSACTVGSTSICDYAFNAVGTTSYTVYFYLEGNSASLSAGAHTLTEKGIQ